MLTNRIILMFLVISLMFISMSFLLSSCQKDEVSEEYYLNRLINKEWESQYGSLGGYIFYDDFKYRNVYNVFSIDSADFSIHIKLDTLVSDWSIKQNIIHFQDLIFNDSIHLTIPSWEIVNIDDECMRVKRLFHNGQSDYLNFELKKSKL